jgi:predicted Zn-dependent protease
MPMNGSGSDYRWLRGMAKGCLLFGRRAQALVILDEMLWRWPCDAYALASRSHLRAQCGRRDAAIADLLALVAAQPGRSAAHWYNLAYLLEAAGRCAEAEPAFRRALALDPHLDRAWYGLGLTLIRLRRPEDAVAALKKNTELQPMSPYGWYQLARVQLDRRQPEETRAIIRRLKGFEPKVAAQLERETGLAA